jgi:hypothetical protein
MIRSLRVASAFDLVVFRYSLRVFCLAAAVGPPPGPRRSLRLASVPATAGGFYPGLQSSLVYLIPLFGLQT